MAQNQADTVLKELRETLLKEGKITRSGQFYIPGISNIKVAKPGDFVIDQSGGDRHEKLKRLPKNVAVGTSFNNLIIPYIDQQLTPFSRLKFEELSRGMNGEDIFKNDKQMAVNSNQIIERAVQLLTKYLDIFYYEQQEVILGTVNNGCGYSIVYTRRYVGILPNTAQALNPEVSLSDMISLRCISRKYSHTYEDVDFPKGTRIFW